MARWMSSSNTYEEPTSLRKALDKGGPSIGAYTVCESIRRMINHGSEGYTRVGWKLCAWRLLSSFSCKPMVIKLVYDTPRTTITTVTIPRARYMMASLMNSDEFYENCIIVKK